MFFSYTTYSTSQTFGHTFLFKGKGRCVQTFDVLYVHTFWEISLFAYFLRVDEKINTTLAYDSGINPLFKLLCIFQSERIIPFNNVVSLSLITCSKSIKTENYLLISQLPWEWTCCWSWAAWFTLLSLWSHFDLRAKQAQTQWEIECLPACCTHLQYRERERERDGNSQGAKRTWRWG